MQSALCLPQAQATITTLELVLINKPSFFCLPPAKHLLCTLGDLLVRVALFLNLYRFNYSNGSIADPKPALVAAVCDGLEQLALRPAGCDGLEQLARSTGSMR